MSQYLGSIFGGGSKKNAYDQEVYSDRGSDRARDDEPFSDGAASPRSEGAGSRRKGLAGSSRAGSRSERPFSLAKDKDGYASRGGVSEARGYDTERSYGGPMTEKSSLGRREGMATHGPAGPASNRGGGGYLGSFAPNPSFIRLLRFLLYLLSSGAAFVTCILAILVVAYYNNNSPSIKPSWGSLIALIVFGFITPGALFITFLITPRLFRYGTVLGIVNQVRIDLLLQFALAGIWVSAALAMASDLRGYENCIWDGYYYYPKPANFNHVCDLINATVIMAYVTFGVIALQWFIITVIAIYILLYLDQEVLSELTNDMGGRAYRARTAALAAAGRASRPETEFSRGAYQSEKGGYMSPRPPGSETSSARRMSRDYSEAEGGRGYGESRRSDEGMSEKRRREDDVEGRSEDGDEVRSGADDDEAYYGYERGERGSNAGGGPMMRDNSRTGRSGPWSENMRDL